MPDMNDLQKKLIAALKATPSSPHLVKSIEMLNETSTYIVPENDFLNVTLFTLNLADSLPPIHSKELRDLASYCIEQLDLTKNAAKRTP